MGERKPGGEVTYRGYQLESWGAGWDIFDAHGEYVTHVALLEGPDGAKAVIDGWLDAP